MSRKKSIKEVLEDFGDIHGNKHDHSLVKYINNHTPVNVMCKKHGLFHPTPYNHLYSSGCPHCKQSKLEERTKDALKKHNVKYESQKNHLNG